MNATERAHGDRAAGQAIEPTPRGRFGLRGITLARPKPKAAPTLTGRIGKPAPVRARVVDGVPPVFAAKKRAIVPAHPAGHSDAVDLRPSGVVTFPKVRTFGAEAIIASLRRDGITLSLSTDAMHIIAHAPAGRLMVDVRTLIETAAPLLIGYLVGTPLLCTVKATHDKAADLTAITLLVGGAPCCAACLAEKGGAA